MTAVEWLRKELETIPNYSTFYTNNYQWIDSIMNKAKLIEIDQMRAIHLMTWINRDFDFEQYIKDKQTKTKLEQ